MVESGRVDGVDAVVGQDDGGDLAESVERARLDHVDVIVGQANVPQLTQPVTFEEFLADLRQSIALEAQVAQLVQVIDGRGGHAAQLIVFQGEPLQMPQRFEQSRREIGFLQGHVQFERLQSVGHVEQRLVTERRQPVERQTQLTQLTGVAQHPTG